MTPYAGAVYLFIFTDGAFSGGQLAAVLGKGYTDGRNVDVDVLEGDDWFGRSVSLDGSGTRLAVGAPGDNGTGNGTENAGAVYLFTFTDRAFSGGRLAAVVGKGYTGGRNVDVDVLEGGDYFGGSVSLNRSGDRLAIGKTSAVYLFTFTDSSFSAGRLAGVVDKDYTGDRYTGSQDVYTSDQDMDTGEGNIDVTALEDALEDALEERDFFGSSVSLNAAGNRLAVGAPGDDGAGNQAYDSAGAVYLFTFTDGAFSGGRLAAVVGKGYTGDQDVDIGEGSAAALERGDWFGHSVSLNGSGTRLAVGAPHDDGAGNEWRSVGAVYLFTFADSSFSGGRLTAVVGRGYTGGRNIYVTGLVGGESFGYSVSLNGSGTRLAVGAPYEDGAS